MEINNKIIVLGTIGLIGLGGVIDHFLTPTKIKTVTEIKTDIKTVKENVYIDRDIVKIVKPDGTIEERTSERDRSKVDRQERVDEQVITKEITNPKSLHLGVSYKGSINDFNVENLLDYKSNLGLNVSYDTGILNTFVQGQVFGDATVILTIGVIF